MPKYTKYIVQLDGHKDVYQGYTVTIRLEATSKEQAEAAARAMEETGELIWEEGDAQTFDSNPMLDNVLVTEVDDVA